MLLQHLEDFLQEGVVERETVAGLLHLGRLPESFQEVAHRGGLAAARRLLLPSQPPQALVDDALHVVQVRVSQSLPERIRVGEQDLLRGGALNRHDVPVDVQRVAVEEVVRRRLVGVLVDQRRGQVDRSVDDQQLARHLPVARQPEDGELLLDLRGYGPARLRLRVPDGRRVHLKAAAHVGQLAGDAAHQAGVGCREQAGQGVRHLEVEAALLQDHETQGHLHQRLHAGRQGL
mmetsp:Transcript_41621/g.109871  ORF Transcript_41621/g.109871 Transcript_41621/m.109871 type:complete len:233 (+) Transcript_41621:771-1469(+)